MPKKENVKNSFWRSTQARYLLIAIAVVCVYGKTLKFGFIGLDDRNLISENYSFISDLSNIPKAFVTHVFYNPQDGKSINVYYRPVLTLSLMLDAQLGGRAPFVYHLTNILLHIISCILLLVLLQKFKITPDLSFAAALLFAVHPLLSQAVAWIPGRNDSLLSVFVFAGFIAFVRYLETKEMKALLLHFFFFGLAMFTKESAIVFPVLCFLCLFLFYKEAGFSFRNAAVLFSGYTVILLPWYILRQKAIAGTTADLSFSGLSSSCVENLPLCLQSVQKSILPFFLSIVSVPADTNYVLSIFIAALIMLLLVRSKNRNNKKVFFGFIWFSAFLLPSFLVNSLTGFEHRVYLPLVGMLLVLSEIGSVKNFKLDTSVSSVAASGIFLVFAVYAFMHTGSFASNYEFWKTASLTSKHSALARMNYGLALSQNGEADKAMAVDKEGIELDSNQHLIHNNLGILYARKKIFPEAEAEFKKEISINPSFGDAYYNLALLYKMTGYDSLVLVNLEAALKADPQNTAAKKEMHDNLNMRSRKNVR